MQHGKIIVQEAQSNTVCRKLRYFILTDDERFYHVLNVFKKIFSRF